MKLTIALAGDQTFIKKPFFRNRKKISYFITIPSYFDILQIFLFSVVFVLSVSFWFKLSVFEKCLSV